MPRKKQSVASLLASRAKEGLLKRQELGTGPTKETKQSGNHGEARASAGKNAAVQLNKIRAKAGSSHRQDSDGLPRIVRSADGGTQKVILQFFDARDGVQKLDLSRVLELENLAEPLIAGLKGHLQAIGSSSRPTQLGAFWHGFYRFMIIEDKSASLKELDESLFHRYINWLNSPDAPVNSDGVLSSQSIRQRIGMLRGVLSHASKVNPWSKDALRALAEIPRNIRTVDDSRPVESLSLDQLLKIQRAASDELAEISARLQRGESALEEGKKKRQQGSADYKDMEVALAAMVEMYPKEFPRSCDAENVPEELFSSVYKSTRGDQRIVNLASYRYAAPSDLVPIILLLAIEGGFNPDSILALEMHQVVDKKVLGTAVTEINAPKLRAKDGRQRKALDSEVVGPWFEVLDYLTTRIRHLARPHLQDFAFLYKAHLGHAKDAKPFQGSGRTMWHHALKDFRERHQLPHFTLSNIRATMVDLVGQNLGSIAAHQAANHTSFRTTDKHYIGSGTRQREREKLGLVMQYNRRFVETRGNVDVRRAARPPTMDKGSATPGFTCIDPYDSPQPGQRKNALCRAYGKCPICPLAEAPAHDPHAVAYWRALVDAINDSRSTLDPQHWLKQWGPVAVELLSLLDSVNEDVLSRATNLRVFLPTVG